MRVLHLSFYALLLLYFLTFLLGRPGIVVSRATAATLDLRIDQESDAGAEEEKPPAVKATISPGLFGRIQLEREALFAFDDPLLESEARPQNLLKSLERLLALDLFLTTLCVAWCFLLILTGLALWKDHWFARRMEVMMALGGTGFFAIYLLFFRRNDLILSDNHGLARLLTAMDTVLLFACLAFLMNRIAAAKKERIADPFMAHTEKSSEHRPAVFTVIYQLLLIALCGLLATNFLLFPLYSAQIHFPGAFGMLILGLIFALILFYIIAYMRVSQKEDYEPSVFSALSFLGYRLLLNTGFFVFLTVMIALGIGAIILLAVFNVNLLEGLRLLWMPSA
ncbi:MAG: hypothetical protein HS115_09005 [Spirochaetales bacterium]|nr:hypothetical protein [Spirochaetales bacterium]